MSERPRPPDDVRTCASCGRAFEWRKKWARDWAHVKYCSDRCRRAGLAPVDLELEQAIVTLLAGRAGGATICPSEAARLVRPEDWADWMERTRAAARRLVARGELEITQRGQPVAPETARGPIRLRAPRPGRP